MHGMDVAAVLSVRLYFVYYRCFPRLAKCSVQIACEVQRWGLVGGYRMSRLVPA